MFLYDTNRLWESNTLAVEHAKGIVGLLGHLGEAVSRSSWDVEQAERSLRISET